MAKEGNRIREVALYKNAALLFNKRGYSSASVRQICREIGIRESSLYYYIKSKEDLLLNICEGAMRVILGVIEPIAKSDLKPQIKIRKMIDLHTATVAKSSNEYFTMLRELRSLSPANRRKIIKLRDRYEDLFRQVIGDCVDKKLFRNVNIKMTTLALLGMMNSVVRWYTPHGPIKSENMAQIFSDMFLNGVTRKIEIRSGRVMGSKNHGIGE